MPGYNWTCLACEHGNKKKDTFCSICGCPAEAKLENVEASKFLLNHGRVKCGNCEKFVEYAFSEDMYHYRKRGALFRILFLDIGCPCNTDKERLEFHIPFFRRLYRKYRDENDERWFFKI